MGRSRDGSRHSYQRCIVCSRSYRIFRCRLLAGRRFCSQRCFWQCWAAFRRALASGQLEGILALAHSDPTPPGTPAAPECLPAAQKPAPDETPPNIAKNSVDCRIAVQPATGIGKSDTSGRRLCTADRNVSSHHARYPWLSPYRKRGPLDHFFLTPSLAVLVFPPPADCM